MKKNIYIIAVMLLAAVITSCNKNWTASDLPAQKMDFSPVVGRMTKGLVTGTTFPTSRSMVLSADHNGTGASGNYFSGVGFSYDSGITAWKPTSGNYYWPISGTLEILAYSGGSVSFSSTPSFTNATSLSMASTDFTADDVLVGGLTGAKYGNNKIAFKHALAKTTFTAYASVGSIIKIKSIELNAKKGATITCSKSSGNSNVTFSTSSHTSAVNISAYSGSTTLTTSEKSIGNTILLPANQTPASITIGYTMTVNSTESPVMYVTKSVSQALTSGSGYKYRIYITLTGINVTATLTDWGDGGNINIPIPEPATFGGLEIASGPLYYNGTSYEIKDSWNYDSYYSVYGKAEGSTYFSFFEMGKLFEKADFSTSDSSITNELDPLDGWRLPMKTEWQSILGTTRAGSTVNGSAGKHYALIQLASVPHAGSSTTNGILIFPDGKDITGKALSDMDNSTQTTGVTLEELNAYLEQGCVFLPASSGCDGGDWFYEDEEGIGGESGIYWSSTEYNGNSAYSCYFYSIDGYLDPASTGGKSDAYFSVRLVRGEPDPVAIAANGHDYVDLGLRVGGNKILFANRNVGAFSTEEEYGDYFAWGDTIERYFYIDDYDNSIEGSTFEWSNCPYHTGDNPSTGWSKYIPSAMTSYWGGPGDPDNKLTLDASDDVASVLWGGSWRMPDKADLEYLVSSNVTYEWVTDWEYTGVNGYLIRGKGDFSSASLFLPAAGNCYGGSRDDAGTFGCYWSRSLYGGAPRYAWLLSFDSNGRSVYGNYRVYGFSVRPVLVIPE